VAEILESAKEALDAVAGLVENLVVAVLNLSVFLWRYHGLAARSLMKSRNWSLS
jgi:hypothetical protein